MKSPASTSIKNASFDEFSYHIQCTRHAKIRQQQRGIHTMALGCLLAYGRSEFNHDHCEIVYFDSRSLERIRLHEGKVLANIVSRHRDIYAVVDCDGCIVTTGHRFKRIQRDRSLVSLRPRRRR